MAVQAVQYQHGSTGTEHVGCFKENKRDRHFKLSPGNYDPKSLTPEKCSSVCGAYMAPYAGMTDGRFCFCGSSKPGPSYKAADGDCSSTCSGDDKTKCGGS
ncbi:xylosyltransferase oxt-like [Haliotis rubra]|uniref:xylosyltransferase oxt-like n=1 Tax=Haliotis rubra TaxID=36100 RepID=UPI001EE56F10|nr:xylosyltransferase oxt-like [Haliotis rubra]